MNTAETQSPLEHKDSQTVAHEKVLRLECLKLSTGTRNVDAKPDEITAAAKIFSTYVIGE